MPYYFVDTGFDMEKYIHNYRALGIKMLFSYAYKDVFDPCFQLMDKDDIIVDSGAFTIASSSNKELNIEGYMDFLYKHQDEYTHAFNFDVIGNPEATYDNQKFLEEQGFDVIPVFHLGSQYKYLRQYINEGYKYISLGGMVRKPTKIKDTFLRKCFSIGVKDQIKFHGLGLNHKYCEKYPLYSIDNSNHTTVFRFAHVRVGKGKVQLKGYSRKNKGDFFKPVKIQVNYNLKAYQDIIRRKRFMYNKYFQDEQIVNEIVGDVNQ